MILYHVLGIFVKVFEMEKRFIKKHLMSISIILAVILITYGIKLFNLSISIDNEAAIVSADSIYNAWNSMGRIGLTFLKKVLGVSVYNPYLAIAFMNVFLLVTCIIYGSLFDYLLGDLHIFPFLVFSTIFVTSPILAEQLGFVMQSVEVLIGMCLIGISIFLFYLSLEKNNLIQLLIGILLAGLAFSIYQALITLFVAVSIGTVVLYYKKNKPTLRNALIVILKLIITFLISVSLYYVVCFIYFRITGLSKTDYTGDQIGWKTNGIKESLRNILSYLYASYFSKRIFYNYNLLISTILISISGINSVIKKEYNFIYYIVIGSLIISPFLMGLILGGTPSVRTELCKVFSIAFMNMFLVDSLDFYKDNVIKKYMLPALVIITLLNQSIVTTRLYYTEYITNLEESSIATKISNEIGQLSGNYSTGQKVIFVGRLQLNRNNSCFKREDLELVGYSHFEVSFSVVHGSYLMNMYMNTLGNNYLLPTEVEINNLKKDYDEMPSWPSKGSIKKVNDCIIVKLSNE